MPETRLAASHLSQNNRWTIQALSSEVFPPLLHIMPPSSGIFVAQYNTSCLTIKTKTVNIWISRWKRQNRQRDNTALAAQTRCCYNQKIQTSVTTTTTNPATRGNTLRYPDRELWSKRQNAELDKVLENGTRHLLKSAYIRLIPKGTKIINITIKFN